jgi:hypothetical protein
MAKVLDNVGRKLFEGPLNAAKAFVESRFPRVHVDPQSAVENPQPDVKVVDDDGGEHTFHGADAPETDGGWQAPETAPEKEAESA